MTVRAARSMRCRLALAGGQSINARRRFVGALVVAGAALAVPRRAVGQPSGVPRVGVLAPGKPPTQRGLEALRQGLRELGYVEGRTIVLELKWNEEQPERWTTLAAELARAKVDVIVAGTSEAVPAAKAATREIPIVMTTASDPLERGWVTSLARPAGNITGLTADAAGLHGKRVELLREAVPRIRRAAVLFTANTPVADGRFKETESAAGRLGIEVQAMPVRGVEDIEEAFRNAMRSGATAVILVQGPLLSHHRARIAELALKHRLPTISAEPAFAEAGGLMNYGPNFPDNWRRAAAYVDRILKGARPGDLPIEQPTKFELTVNLKTAKALGLTIAPSILLRADRVIE